jgi:hypothetical protein
MPNKLTFEPVVFNVRSLATVGLTPPFLGRFNESKVGFIEDGSFLSLPKNR